MAQYTEFGIGFMRVDGDGIIVESNDSADTLLGVNPLGLMWSNIYVDNFKPNMNTYLLTKTKRNIDLKISHNGDEVLIYMNDISEILDLANAMNKKTRIKMMSEMASTVSHQLKTPLSVVLMQAEMIEDECIESVVRVEKIKNSIFSITELLNSMFEFSKKSESAPEISSSSTMLAAIKTNYAHITDIDISGDNTNFVGNNSMMVSAISNLVDNSIDECAEDLNISISTKVEDMNLQIRYKDNAGGISKNADLFKKIRVPSHKKGWGIGMSVTKFIIDAHGGSISYKNVSSGIEIFISIPLEGSLIGGFK